MAPELVALAMFAVLVLGLFMGHPLAFVLGIVGTYIGRNKIEDPAKQAEMEVRSLTGVGVEKAVSH